MKTMNYFKTSILFFGIYFFSSCSSDDVKPVNEEEEITHVILNVDGVPYTFEIGSETPTIELNVNQTHNFSVKFEDRSNLDDIEDITEEVIAEADEHFVVYEVAGLENYSMSRADDDTTNSDGKKIGLKTNWTVSSEQTGKAINIRLVHDATSVDDEANGNLGSTSDDGGTDAVATFNINVVTPV